MRFFKKERKDIKSFMNQLSKGNQSHRSYASIESRTEKNSNQPERRPAELYPNYSKTTSVHPYFGNHPSNRNNQDPFYSKGSMDYSNYNQFGGQHQNFPYLSNTIPTQTMYGQGNQTFSQVSQSYCEPNHLYGQPHQSFQMNQGFESAPYHGSSYKVGNSMEFSNGNNYRFSQKEDDMNQSRKNSFLLQNQPFGESWEKQPDQVLLNSDLTKTMPVEQGSILKVSPLEENKTTEQEKTSTKTKQCKPEKKKRKPRKKNTEKSDPKVDKSHQNSHENHKIDNSSLIREKFEEIPEKYDFEKLKRANYITKEILEDLNCRIERKLKGIDFANQIHRIQRLLGQLEQYEINIQKPQKESLTKLIQLESIVMKKVGLALK